MYANRYADGPRFRPASMGVALAINGGIIAALLLAPPDLIPKIIEHAPTTIIDIEAPEPPPLPEPQKREPAPRPSATIATPIPPLPLPPGPNPIEGKAPDGARIGTGTAPTGDPTAVPLPEPLPFVGVRSDPRYAAGFQPPYPDAERDMGREGVVELRVLVGVDGRVKRVERISGRDSFARVAIQHALAKWRFLPATRGGVPEEAWRTMIVRFELGS